MRIPFLLCLGLCFLPLLKCGNAVTSGISIPGLVMTGGSMVVVKLSVVYVNGGGVYVIDKGKGGKTKMHGKSQFIL